MKVGVVGLGVMGWRIAANLSSANLLHRVYNRSTNKGHEFEKSYGVRVSPSIGTLVQDCDLVLTMLSDDSAVREVYAEILPHVRGGQVFADMSTITPSSSTDLAREIEKRRGIMFDAPVVGSSAAVEKKEVVVLVGGESERFEELKSILQATAKEVVHVGPNGSGLSLKLVNNLVLAAYMASLGEAAHFGLQMGLMPEFIEKLFTSLSSLRSQSSALKIPKILKADYSTAFSLKHMTKDLALIELEAIKHHSSTPLASLSLQLYRMAEQQGLGDKDYIAVSELFRNRLPSP